VSAGEHYVGKILVNGHAWSEDASWLVSPIAGAAAFAALAVVVGSRFIRLGRGGGE
jgi:ABC-2 type transport system permease protein